jgi:small-conductance mechanosensitive channel
MSNTIKKLSTLYVLLPALFLVSFLLAIAKSFRPSLAENTSIKIVTIILMVIIGIACFMGADFTAQIIIQKRNKSNKPSCFADGLKLFGFIASVVGCAELCFVLSGYKGKGLLSSEHWSVSSSICFVLSTILLTFGIFLWEHARVKPSPKNENSNTHNPFVLLKRMVSYRCSILFIFQVIGASAFLIQGFNNPVKTNAKIYQHWNTLVKTFLILGAISALGLLYCGVDDYHQSGSSQSQQLNSK